MSWVEKLYDTYERCDGAPQFEDDPLMPISHTVQQAHIEIVLDLDGNFCRAKCVQKEETIIPATEASAGRVGTKPPPHPLCDKIQYCAGDYPAFGGEKVSFHAEYLELLRRWCSSKFSNSKVNAVLRYVEKGTVVKDLVDAHLLHCNLSGKKLITEWAEDSPAPDLFRMLTPKSGKRDQGDAFVRWRVEIPSDLYTLVSEDPNVRRAWIDFDAAENSQSGLCMVTGATTHLASSHPKRLRHGADGAKLISSNDISNFTFRGRFLNSEEACGVSSEVTQKAHNALRWLIGRQGSESKNGDQVFVAWSIGGQKIPDPLKNTLQLFLDVPTAIEANETPYAGDAGQQFALQLKKLIAGYGAKLAKTDNVIIMGVDSATPGRMAVTFYRELTGSEFLERVLQWHEANAWYQNFSKELKFIGAPAPRDIAEAAFGRRLDDKLRKATVERLLPCIVDGQPVPRDLVESTVRRTCNRVGLKPWDWEKCLGIACGLYNGRQKEEKYQMSLEGNRTSRDYLFGRLLAIADHLEQRALHVAGEDRDTNAARLMQRFSEHPYSTWTNIELSLRPYEARLRAKRPGVLNSLKRVLDEVMNKFDGQDYKNDSKLTGEFLLGYHCQRSALWERQDPTNEEEVAN